MVFFITSVNVKILKDMIVTFKNTSNATSLEYLKDYIEKCPKDIDDNKLEWITSMFLGYLKHEEFLQDVYSLLLNEDVFHPLCADDHKYFTIILYAMVFHLDPKYVDLLYKCIFNLSKPLLKKFSGFLVKSESLRKIYDIGTNSFDLTYVTEKILNPLTEWQPCIQKMADDYSEYVENIKTRRIKPTTVPKEPRFTHRKVKKELSPQEVIPSKAPDVSQPVLPSTKKIVTKEALDEKIKLCHKMNKLKATNLLNEALNLDSNFAKKYTAKEIVIDEDNICTKMSKPIPLNYKSVYKKNVIVKDTALTLKRLNRRIQVEEEKEVQWLDQLVTCPSSAMFDDLEEQIRRDEERKRLLDIEKKHLMGQLSYEEAVLAKKKQLDENKKKYEQFLKEKQLWNEEIENWRKIEEENNKKNVEKLSLLELNVLEAKSSICEKNKQSANQVKKESDLIRKIILKERNEELERRFKLIKEIKILALVAKQARVPKVIDLTETSGIGSFCEMSIAELQERLVAMKINIQEEVEIKRKYIREEIASAKQDLENTKKSIDEYLLERAQLRKENKAFQKNQQKIFNRTHSDEIDELKKKLENKRKLRIQLRT